MEEDNKVVNETPMPCPEPGCSGTLRLRHSHHGWYYACDQWKKTRCHGTVAAHADGRPMGVPAPQRTRVMRQVAHHFFDKLWQEWPMERPEAYERMRKRMGMEEELHIGNLGEDGCGRLIECVQAELNVLRGFTSSFDGVPSEHVELEGPFECAICGGHLMVDVSFLNKVSWTITCPYCQQSGKVKVS